MTDEQTEYAEKASDEINEEPNYHKVDVQYTAEVKLRLQMFDSGRLKPDKKNSTIKP